MIQKTFTMAWRRIVAFSASLALALTLIPATALIAPASAEPDVAPAAEIPVGGYMKWGEKIIEWVIREGVLTISTDEYGISDDTSINPWVAKGHKDKVKEVKIVGTVKAPDSLEKMFENHTNLTSVDLTGLDTSNVTSMNGMFAGCKELTTVSFLELDAKKVKDLSGMFFNCKKIKELNLSNLITQTSVKNGNPYSVVQDMSRMFAGCESLETLTLGGSFLTSSVGNMSELFDGCEALTNFDFLKSMRFDNVWNMDYMFRGCSKLGYVSEGQTPPTITFPNSFTTSATTMKGMFSGCTSLVSLDVLNFTTNLVLNMSEMFKGCEKLEGVYNLSTSGFDTSGSGYTSYLPDGTDRTGVTDMHEMFSGCKSLETLDVSKFVTKDVGDMHDMFKDCSSLTSLDLSSFDTSKAWSMEGMFEGCFNKEELRNIYLTLGEKFVGKGNSGL